MQPVYSRLKGLEMKVFGKTFEGEDIVSRIARLEKKMLGKPQSGKTMERLDNLLLMQ